MREFTIVDVGNGRYSHIGRAVFLPSGMRKFLENCQENPIPDVIFSAQRIPLITAPSRVAG